jgi:hypothetical protein
MTPFDIYSLEFYLYPLLIAVFSYVYTNVLTEPNMILNGLYNWSDRNLYKWLHYPFIHCEKCNAGQIALFTYVLNNLINYKEWAFYTELFSFITLTILLTLIIKKTKLNE